MNELMLWLKSNGFINSTDTFSVGAVTIIEEDGKLSVYTTPQQIDTFLAQYQHLHDIYWGKVKGYIIRPDNSIISATLSLTRQEILYESSI